MGSHWGLNQWLLKCNTDKLTPELCLIRHNPILKLKLNWKNTKQDKGFFNFAVINTCAKTTTMHFTTSTVLPIKSDSDDMFCSQVIRDLESIDIRRVGLTHKRSRDSR